MARGPETKYYLFILTGQADEGLARGDHGEVLGWRRSGRDGEMLAGGGGAAGAGRGGGARAAELQGPAEEEMGRRSCRDRRRRSWGGGGAGTEHDP
jgi:hypothetical protein